MLIKYGVDFLFPKNIPAPWYIKRVKFHLDGLLGSIVRVFIYIYIFFFFFFFLLPQSIDEVPGRSRPSRTDDNLNYNRLNWLTDVACKKNNKEKKKILQKFLGLLKWFSGTIHS